MERSDVGSLRMSVLIPTYARPESLRRALASLSCQTRPPHEVLVGAWRGDSATVALLEELRRGGDVPRPVVVPVERNARLAKDNAMIRAATGDVLCFTDDDAAPRSDWLARLAAYYKDPRVGAVGGRDVVWVDGKEFARPARTVGHVSWFGRLAGNHHERVVGVRNVDFLKAVNMSVRRELMREVDPLLIGENTYGFEIDVGLGVKERGLLVVFDPDAAVDHYPTTYYGAEAPIARVVNHNQTYVLLKRLPWPRRVVFLVYTFLVGDKNTIGVLRIPGLLWRDRWPLRSVIAHLGGKWAGVATYIAASRGTGTREA